MKDKKMENFSKETKTKKELSLEEAKLVSGGSSSDSKFNTADMKWHS